MNLKESRKGFMEVLDRKMDYNLKKFKSLLWKGGKEDYIHIKELKSGKIL